MLDLGLLATGVVIWAVLAAAARWAPTSTFRRDEIIDRLYLPAFTGLLVGRIVAVVFDDPTSLRSVRALIVIRGRRLTELTDEEERHDLDEKSERTSRRAPTDQHPRKAGPARVGYPFSCSPRSAVAW